MEPTRKDLSMMSGTTQEFDFEILSDAGPIDITLDTIDVYVAQGYGRAWKYRFSKLPGTHLNPLAGITRIALVFPALLTTQIWWYETWRREDAKPHIIGELQLIGSIRT
jgi:hypothetical protein